MKKRIISFMLSLSLLAGMGAMPVAAAAEAVVPEKMYFQNYPEISTYYESCNVGDTYTLTVKIEPAGSLRDVVWAIEDPAVGEIISYDGSSVTVKALAVGHTKVVATAHGGVVAKAILNVIPTSNYDEPYRPQYHFSPEVYWINDPNGLVYYEGEWHLFFQYNPYNNLRNSPIMWGHAVSTDMVHWDELPIAIFPDNDDFGNTFPGNENLGRIFSGSCVVDENNTTGFFDDTPEKKGLVAIFTHASSLSVDDVRVGQSQSIAYSTDKGRTWMKYEGNPVISSANYEKIFGKRGGDPSDPLENSAFRDPKVFWHDESNQWIMAVAGGPLRFYSSSDLKTWKAEAMQPDIVTECPDLFRLPISGTDETKWVLCEGGRYYRLGDFKQVDGLWTFVTDADPGNYDPNSELSADIARYYMNYGADAYAAQTFANGPDGRVVLVQYMSNWSYSVRTLNRVFSPWNGQMTLLEELSLIRLEDGSIRLQQTPVPEYEALRQEGTLLKDVTLTPENNVMEGITGDVYEIKATLTPEKGASEAGFRLLKGNGYETVVKYDFETQTVTTDKSLAGPRVDFVDDKQNGEHWTFFDGKLMYPSESYAQALENKDEIVVLPYAKAAPMSDGSIDLHIFVDKSSVEVHAGSYTALGTCLILPEEGNVAIEAYAMGGNVKADIEFYPLNSIWK